MRGQHPRRVQLEPVLVQRRLVRERRAAHAAAVLAEGRLVGRWEHKSQHLNQQGKQKDCFKSLAGTVSNILTTIAEAKHSLVGMSVHSRMDIGFKKI